MKFINYILLFIFCVTFLEVSGNQSPKKKKKKKKKTANKEIVIPKEIILTQEQQDAFNFAFAEGLRRKSLGQIEKASLYFIESLKIDSTSSACYFELANFALTATALDDALAFSKKAVQFNPNNKWYLLQLAQIYQSKRMISDAEKFMIG